MLQILGSSAFPEINYEFGILGQKINDLFNNVKIGQGQLQLIIKHILFYHIWGLQPFRSSDLNNLTNTPSNSPVISEKPMFI